MLSVKRLCLIAAIIVGAFIFGLYASNREVRIEKIGERGRGANSAFSYEIIRVRVDDRISIPCVSMVGNQARNAEASVSISCGWTPEAIKSLNTTEAEK